MTLRRVETSGYNFKRNKFAFYRNDELCLIFKLWNSLASTEIVSILIAKSYLVIQYVNSLGSAVHLSFKYPEEILSIFNLLNFKFNKII